jgi:hypothetical protein
LKEGRGGFDRKGDLPDEVGEDQDHPRSGEYNPPFVVGGGLRPQ